MTWVECIGPEGQIGKLRPCIANIAVNLWGREVLKQWNTQINIPASPKVIFLRNILEYITDDEYHPFRL